MVLIHDVLHQLGYGWMLSSIDGIRLDAAMTVCVRTDGMKTRPLTVQMLVDQELHAYG